MLYQQRYHYITVECLHLLEIFVGSFWIKQNREIPQDVYRESQLIKLFLFN